jgi:hypothetical protein
MAKQRLKHIVASRTDGLGGKLINLAVTLRVAKKLGLIHSVCWYYKPIPQKIIYHKLFESLTFVPENHFEDKGLKVYHLTREQNKKSKLNEFEITDDIIKNYDVVITDHLDNLQFKCKDKEDYYKELGVILKSITPNKYIRNKVKDFISKYNLKKYTGVHVRRGDVEQNIKRGVDLHKFAKEDELFKCLKRIKSKKIFLSTECNKVKENFVKEFGKNNVKFYDARLYIRERPQHDLHGTDEEVLQSLEDAYVDNILLSECKEILNAQSNFSKVAAIRSNTPSTNVKEFLNSHYRGQKLQDKWIYEDVFDKAKYGFFVDIGAYDPIKLNNTYVLEKKASWNGIAIDADSRFISDFKIKRKCKWVQACLTDNSGEEVKFLELGGPSGIIKYITREDILKKANELIKKKDRHIVKYKTKLLSNVLKSSSCPKLIHYMDIDTGGAEYVVIKKFPFNKYKIIAITIQHNNDNKLKHKINMLLEKNGYTNVKSFGRTDEGYILNEYLIEKNKINKRKIKLSIKQRPMYLEFLAKIKNYAKKSIKRQLIKHKRDETDGRY